MSTNLSKFLGAILPSHTDYKPIIDDMRQKYNIPKLVEADKEIGEFLLSDSDIPWELIHSELKQRIQEADDLWPKGILKLSKSFNKSLRTDPNLEKLTEDYKAIPVDLR